MSALDWAVLAVLAVWIAASVVWMLRRKKKGKCLGCDGNCDRCPYQK